MYQDNTACIALMERGRSGAERTHRISVRYIWLRERVESGAQGDQRDVRERTYEAAAGVTVRVRKGMPHGMDVMRCVDYTDMRAHILIMRGMSMLCDLRPVLGVCWILRT